MSNNIKYILFFLLYFFIHYAEGLPPIGAFSFAQLWKIPILLIVLWVSLSSKHKWTRMEKFGYLYSIEPFLCPVVFKEFFATFLFASKQLPMILFFRFWIDKFQNRIEVLEKIIYSFAQFICLSSAVVLLGIITPIRQMSSAGAFMDDLVYYSAVFGNAHCASSYFCVAIVILITGFMVGYFKTKKSKMFNLILIVVGLISVFKSYVRTGWLMLLVSLFFVIDLKKIDLRNIMKYFVVAFVFIVGVFTLYTKNEAFQNRIAGKTKYNEATQIIDVQGSGRIDFWITGIKNWTENDFYHLLFGKGNKAVMLDNYRSTGILRFSHNQFVDSLARYGLVSVVLLILYFIAISKFIKKYGKGSPYQQMCKSILWGALIFSFFQNEIYFDYAVVFSLSLAIMYFTNAYNQSCNKVVD